MRTRDPRRWPPPLALEVRGFTRRELLEAGAAVGLLAGLPFGTSAAAQPRPAVAAQPQTPVAGEVRRGAPGPVTREIAIRAEPVEIAGGVGDGLTLDGAIPGPLIELYEGHEAVLRVSNQLAEDSSIHWHGILLPFEMDGVPGVSFPGIRPGETFEARFPVRQSGTYWYHSHSGLQEQSGVYGPLVVHPTEPDPHEVGRDYVLLLSDWTFEDPRRVLARLAKQSDYYNFQQPTALDFARAVAQRGWWPALRERIDWGLMRMSPADIADVTGHTYHYLLNGRDSQGNWTGLFEPGERVRLRLINASSMTFFNFRIPGLPMTVVAADGPAVEPVEVDELQIGVAETYDVIVAPGDRAYTLFAESLDRSGYARGTLTPRPGLVAPVPALREPPRRSMRDMGMDHGADGAHDGHGAHGAHDAHGAHTAPAHRHGPDRHGVGNAGVAHLQLDRLAEPGAGLEDVPHRVLVYADLRSAAPIPGPDRPPDRELELHLTGNMERYMWSFDGLRFHEVEGPIELAYGERVRLVLVNDTMMEHPIHLHGMFMQLENGHGAHRPLKHTLAVKPAERVALVVDATEPGRWAFHCHLLYHMEMGMMRVVRVGDPPEGAA